MAEGEGVGELKLEHTPTWIVAVVCSIIIFFSLLVERILHFLGKLLCLSLCLCLCLCLFHIRLTVSVYMMMMQLLKRKNQKPLFEALQKVKEELMLLGFISLLLVAFQGAIQRTCIPPSLVRHMLPCSLDEDGKVDAHFASAGVGLRRLLSGGDGEGSAHCANKGKVPLLSLEAIHQLHIFIFVLAVTHVALSALTILLSGAKIRQWKQWEDKIQKENPGNVPNKLTHVNQLEFIREHFKGFGKDSMILSWLHSFGKQFYGSMTKSDYTTMRLGFIMTHCQGNPKFDFYKYMVRALEADFKRVVGISWYLWIFVVVFLLLNVHGWHAYFWMSSIPLILLFVLGTKLEHIITQLAHEVAEKHTAIEGDLVVKPSDYHFWFHRPRIVLYLIHFILFENAFEISFFFWILAAYGFNSCIMGQAWFIIPRLVMSVIIQLLCSYSTLPLYAIVTQMGSSFKKVIFDEHVQESLVDWAQKAKKREGRKTTDEENKSNTMAFENRSTVGIQLQKLLVRNDSCMEDGIHEPVRSTID